MPKRANALSAEARAFQAKLRLWRKSRKMTLDQLAEQTGYAVSTLSGWETGEREVGTEDLVRLAAVYGVHPAALLMAPEEASPKVARMIRASGLAERLGDQPAEQWLAIGETLATDRREK
ncbi:MAG: helix-turn-helix domain-containing protein [Acetobacteraceae bacterium]|nr:helix-turn-helix domain-containing protein [Acetobacteraceae bacterium]